MEKINKLEINEKEIKTLEKNLKVVKKKQIGTMLGAVTTGIGTVVPIFPPAMVSDPLATAIGLTGLTAATILSMHFISYSCERVNTEQELTERKRFALK